jgi:N,N-dimethylformamidase
VHTATYLAYANDVMADFPTGYELGFGNVAEFTREKIERIRRREYGLSLYDSHSDGSRVWYSSWKRPVLWPVQPGHRDPGMSNIGCEFPLDLCLIDWFDHNGYAIDILTDHDLHREGAGALESYGLVVTASHPEYCSENMLNALHEHIQDTGGRLMYLGGNGFYWVTAFHPEDPRTVEVRRTNNKPPAHPGEDFLSFTGEPGGLWRDRGRPPQKLAGVGFISQGGDASGHFLRRSDSREPETDWIFDGIPDGPIGDYGLYKNGAAGGETDTTDPRLGTPGWAHVLAASQGHSRYALEVRENFGSTMPVMGGDRDPRVRADMVYFKTAGGGAVFSVGSLSWCGSLSHNDYDNPVSRLTKNVVDRFATDAPLP